MGDQLEQFIMKNQEAFNDGEPSDKVWKGINKRLDKRVNVLQVVWKVAAMLFMVSTVYLLVDKNLDSAQTGRQFSDEFTQAEDYYTQLINMKRSEIQQKLTPDELDEFLEDLDQLDELYIELKKTYQANAANDRVLGCDDKQPSASAGDP